MKILLLEELLACTPCSFTVFFLTGIHYFQRREFSFTFTNSSLVRFQSFTNVEEFQKVILKEKPTKIDIGPVYNLSVKEKNHPRFKPSEKELVFDIDISDYDDVRTCCKTANICTKCWKYMAVACKILDMALREDFGFQHLLWVFSGRRGIHCWVCDDGARKLKAEARAAIANYLQLIDGGVYMPKKVKIVSENQHHSVIRAMKIINDAFINVCIQEQDILGTENGLSHFLDAIGDENMKEEVKAVLLNQSSSLNRWSTFVTFIKELQEKRLLNSNCKHIIDELMIQYMYPRLDMIVTKGVDHLLKSPFSIHPETGKISVPFELKEVDAFNPENIPTICSLMEEFNQRRLSHIDECQKTSLTKYICIFEQFLSSLDQSIRNNKIAPSVQPLKTSWEEA